MQSKFHEITSRSFCAVTAFRFVIPSGGGKDLSIHYVKIKGEYYEQKIINISITRGGSSLGFVLTVSLWICLGFGFGFFLVFLCFFFLIRITEYMAFEGPHTQERLLLDSGVLTALLPSHDCRHTGGQWYCPSACELSRQ